MLFPDVNIFVYAMREELPQHADARNWLEGALGGDEEVGLFDPVLVSLVRIVTNRRIFKTPTPMNVALDFVEVIKSAPAVRPLPMSDDVWLKFNRICRESSLMGDDVPDAYLAAVVTAHEAVLVSTDAGFARFAGLKWTRPF